jgi:hypothetical protein
MLRAQAILVLVSVVLATVYALCLPLIFAPRPNDKPAADPALVEACAPYLPPGVSLDTRFSRFDFWGQETVTVRERLMELTAYPEAGTIYAADGFPIYFHAPVPSYSQDWNANPLAVTISREDQVRIETLGRKGIVIVLYPEPPTFSQVRPDTSDPPQ